MCVSAFQLALQSRLCDRTQIGEYYPGAVRYTQADLIDPSDDYDDTNVLFYSPDMTLKDRGPWAGTRETKELEGRSTKEGHGQRETQQIRNWEGGKKRWGGKIVGTVRQIEAGDELSGSIINPHPLLFNILKTPTAHTEQSTSSLQHYPSAAMLKASTGPEKSCFSAFCCF